MTEHGETVERGRSAVFEETGDELERVVVHLALKRSWGRWSGEAGRVFSGTGTHRDSRACSVLRMRGGVGCASRSRCVDVNTLGAMRDCELTEWSCCASVSTPVHLGAWNDLRVVFAAHAQRLVVLVLCEAGSVYGLVCSDVEECDLVGAETDDGPVQLESVVDGAHLAHADCVWEEPGVCDLCVPRPGDVGERAEEDAVHGGGEGVRGEATDCAEERAGGRERVEGEGLWDGHGRGRERVAGASGYLSERLDA